MTVLHVLFKVYLIITLNILLVLEFSSDFDKTDPLAVILISRFCLLPTICAFWPFILIYNLTVLKDPKHFRFGFVIPLPDEYKKEGDEET